MGDGNLNGIGGKRKVTPEGRHSEEIQEIIGRTPPWILNWGIPIIVAILLLMIFVSMLVKYPETVRCTFKVVGVTKDRFVATTISGSLDTIFFEDESRVKDGDVLAYLTCSASLNDILKVCRSIQRVSLKAGALQKEDALDTVRPSLVNLGSLQAEYENLYKAYKSSYRPLTREFGIHLANFMEKIENVVRKYILTANGNGLLMYSGMLEKNLSLDSNQKIFSIRAANQRYYGSIQLPTSKISLLKLGQQVLIDLSTYGDRFRNLNGRVSYISDNSLDDSSYTANVAFVGTDIDTSMKLQNSMNGQAEVFLANKTLFQRFLESL